MRDALPVAGGCEDGYNKYESIESLMNLVQSRIVSTYNVKKICGNLCWHFTLVNHHANPTNLHEFYEIERGRSVLPTYM